MRGSGIPSLSAGVLESQLQASSPGADGAAHRRVQRKQELRARRAMLQAKIAAKKMLQSEQAGEWVAVQYSNIIM